jgi:hypothetical protein
MKYNVPQFVEEEAKILGPFNIRDFFIIFGAGLLSAIFFFIFQQWLAIILATIVFGGTAASLLVKVNGRPLYTIILAAIQFFWSPRLYLWKKEAVRQEEILREKPRGAQIPNKQPEPSRSSIKTSKLTLSRIRELAKQLDISDANSPQTASIQQAQSPKEWKKAEQMPRYSSKENGKTDILPLPKGLPERKALTPEKIRELAKQLNTRSKS